ncbi:amino acid permease-associated region [Novosphingobium nitrogenifigens DSM 19370]|uniref:Amino acid permease-associated region n=1 Tax=Novosphingobium nitrogenifigens DSM 19370 TaxID=983920 RepID=F1ZDB5_9SPHN|nr:APC family permease [Novosphingobium nitrogenifigens]EGD57443.1 amino acid permease-associated region [Novosphingobium nitrogenifigens DSM 19370]
MTAASPTPRPHLGLVAATLVGLGMIMSTDALKTAPTVALNVAPGGFLWLWIAGGLVSLIGALSYVEMACAFPDAGGEYSFLTRAWGSRVGALYAWSRFAVMHTGWIALMAHLLADYVSALVPLGSLGRTLVALAVVAALALLNCIHVRLGFLTQALLVGLVALGFLAVTAAGFSVTPPPLAATPPPTEPHLGVALIYVFLAYGGWSDMATLSAELKAGRRGMAVVTIGAVLLLIAIYVALNAAMLHGLGWARLAQSTAPGADVARAAFGAPGAVVIVAVVAISAIASINSTLIICARITWAASRTLPRLAMLGHWHPERGTPARAVGAVAAFSLVLTALAGFTTSGFGAMVDYMTPVYWVFMALGMGASIRLRRRHDGQRGHDFPVRTPLFPLFPLAFIALALVMLWSSLTQMGPGALFGMGVMAAGLLLERFAAKAVSGRTVPG